MDCVVACENIRFSSLFAAGEDVLSCVHFLLVIVMTEYYMA